MRKTTKLLLGVGALVATPIVINHMITKNAQARLPKRLSESTYNWEYGDIRYVTFGEGSPLLLLHGIYPGAGAVEFKDIIGELAKDYKVYVPDLLGFGYSDKPNVSYSAYLYVRLINDFVQDVVGGPVVAAASLHTAASLATCAKLYPESFTKIVLISPTGTNENVEMATDVEAKAKKALESPVFGTSIYHALTSKKALPEFFEREGLIAKPDAETLDEFYLSAHAGGVGGKYPMAALIAKFFNSDITQTLEDLTVPYHIITGSIPPNSKQFALWKEMGDNVATTVVENARLLPHLDKPKDFLATFKELV